MSGAIGGSGFGPVHTPVSGVGDPAGPAAPGSGSGAGGASGPGATVVRGTTPVARGPGSGAPAAPAKPLDLAAIERGHVHFELPIRAGDHTLDVGGDERAELEVEPGTTLTIEGAITNPGDGPNLAAARVQLSKPIRMTNPGAVLDRWWEGAANALADLDITGFRVGGDGRLHLDGELVFPLGIRRPLSSVVSEDRIPRLDMDLEDVLAGKPFAYRPPPRPQGPALRPAVEVLLQGLGNIVGQGTFAVTLEGKHNTIDLGPNAVVIRGSAPGDAKVEIRGTADVEGGAFVLAGRATGTTAVGTVDGTVDASVRGVRGVRLGVDVTADVRASVDLVDSEATLPTGHVVSIDGDRSAREFQVSAILRAGATPGTGSGAGGAGSGGAGAGGAGGAGGGNVRLEGGRVDVDLYASAPLSIERAGVNASVAADAHVTGSSDFAASRPDGLTVRDGRFTVDARGRAAADVDKARVDAHVGGDVTARAEAHVTAAGGRVRVDAPTTFSATGLRGDATVDTGAVRVPVTVTGDGSVIAGSMRVAVDGRDVRVSDGQVDVRLGVDVDRPRLDVLGGSLTLDGDALVSGRSRFAFDRAAGFRIDGGEVSLAANLGEGELAARGLRVGIGAGSTVTAEATGVRYGRSGLAIENTTSGFDLRLAGADVQIGPMAVHLDNAATSRIRGSTELLALEAGNRLALRDTGRATIDFEIHGTDLRGSVERGTAFETGPGAKTFTGNAKLLITSDAVEVTEGRLSIEADLAGTRITRPQQ